MVTKQSTSHYVSIRGLRYHYRRWEACGLHAAPGEATAIGDAARPAPLLVLLHGWMDVSASFQFLVDALARHGTVIAPDWRGFGETDWAGTDSYWFPDYLADLDALLDQVSADRPVDLLGHSMGGNVACLYAGIRPGRVRRLVNLEGFGLAPQPAASAVDRYGRWLNEMREPQRLRSYPDFDALAERLQSNNHRLSGARAAYLARHWALEQSDGRVHLRADPAHKRVNPVRYRLDEAEACWQAVRAPVLWVDGADSLTPGQLHLDAQALAERRALFQNLRWERLADCGHMLHHDQPEALARLLQRFLDD